MLRDVDDEGRRRDLPELDGATLAGVRVGAAWPHRRHRGSPIVRRRGQRGDGSGWVVEAVRVEVAEALGEVHGHGQRLRELSRGAPGLPEIVHFGVVPRERDGSVREHAAQGETVALVRAFVPGTSLEDQLRARREAGQGGRSLLEALAFVRPIADALVTLQSLEGHHGALEPSAILVGEDHAPSLLGLGHGMLRRLSGAEPPRTLRHAAPEQVDPSLGPVSPRTDVFSLALVFLEVVSGAPTFVDGDPRYFERLVDRARRPSLRDHGLLVADPVERALTQALAVDPRARPSGVGAFLDALSAAVRVSPRVSPLEAPALPRVSSAPPNSKKRPRLPTSTVLAAAVAFGLAAFGVESLLRRGGGAGTSGAAATSASGSSGSTTAASASAAPAASVSPSASATPEPPPPPPPPTVALVVSGRTLRIDRTEVTVAAYRACIDAGSCTTTREHGHGWDAKDPVRRFHVCNLHEPDRDRHPINCVSFSQAARYCGFVHGRLPTGREFTAAVTGGERRRFPWGNDTPTCEQAVFARYGPDNWGCRKEPVGTAAVDAHPMTASAAGALDLAGNVWEWTDVRDGALAELRGGGWDSSEKNLVVDAVLPQAIFNGEVNVGFRCVYDP